MPEGRLPPLPVVFAAPPEWPPSRTLPVNELLAEEQKAIDERWDVERLAERLGRHRRLARILKQERLTAEQFVGLSLAIGLALSRGTLRAEQDLEQIVERGRQAIERLTDEKLAVYNQVLKEQADELQWELDELPYHPRYQPIMVETGPLGIPMQTDGPTEAWRLDRMIASLEAGLARLRTDEALAEVRGAIQAFRAVSQGRS